MHFSYNKTAPVPELASGENEIIIICFSFDLSAWELISVPKIVSQCFILSYSIFFPSRTHPEGSTGTNNTNEPAAGGGPARGA